ncbi:MAG TPA: hypothetical protein VJ725_28185 [Thermoanaerobaculia bacterium]|nr:hypothetical protein [Thermoanaerobaculia bacterium]
MRRLKVIEQPIRSFRLGGPVPGLPLSFDLERYAFFGCFPWLPDESLGLSLFVSIDDDELFDSERKIEDGNGAVKVVLHDLEVPEIVQAHSFFRRSYGLETGGEELDEGEFEGQVFAPAVGNKLLGDPSLIHSSSEQLVEPLLSDGYRLYLQLDNPMYGEPHLGEIWPFQDGLFFLFSRHDANAVSWKCLWEHG